MEKQLKSYKNWQIWKLKNNNDTSWRYFGKNTDEVIFESRSLADLKRRIDKEV